MESSNSMARSRLRVDPEIGSPNAAETGGPDWLFTRIDFRVFQALPVSAKRPLPGTKLASMRIPSGSSNSTRDARMILAPSALATSWMAAEAVLREPVLGAVDACRSKGDACAAAATEEVVWPVDKRDHLQGMQQRLMERHRPLHVADREPNVRDAIDAGHSNPPWSALPVSAAPDAGDQTGSAR